MSYLARALSLRVMFFSFLTGLGAGILVSIVSSTLVTPVVFTVAAATYALTVWGGGNGGGQMVKCPACLKRVKMGASTCHHCGYSNAV